jgi:hypothetical protein
LETGYRVLQNAASDFPVLTEKRLILHPAPIGGHVHAGLKTGLVDGFKCFEYDELIQRDKTSLDIFWLKDESVEDSANIPAQEVLAQDILENLQAALEQFAGIYEELERGMDRSKFAESV